MYNDECSEVDLANNIATAYSELLCSGDSELSDLMEDMTLMSDIPLTDPLWDILKEQLAIVLQEIVADLIPGGTVVTVGPELLENIRAGNWQQAMFNALDIALNEADNFNPTCKGLSLGVSVVSKTGQLGRFYKVFKRLKTFSNEVVSPLYTVLKNKLGKDLYTRFKWKGKHEGAVLTGPADPLEYFEDILLFFGKTFQKQALMVMAIK